jgi:membrane protein
LSKRISLGDPFRRIAPPRCLAAAFRQTAALVWNAGVALNVHGGFELSGHAAFTAILAMFPFLIFVTALAGFVGQPEDVVRITAAALRFVPAEVGGVLSPVVKQVTSQRDGGLLTLGILGAVWSASSGLEALRVMLNRSYDVRETRPFWRLRLQSIVIVVFAAVIAMPLSLVIVLGPILLRLIHVLVSPGLISESLWLLARYGVATLVGTSSLIALHLLLPDRNHAIRQVWPGTVVTVVLWLIMATLFSFYVQGFTHYSVLYGSLGGIVLTLLFFYVSAVIFAYGAEINAELVRDARRCRDQPRTREIA